MKKNAVELKRTVDSLLVPYQNPLVSTLVTALRNLISIRVNYSSRVPVNLHDVGKLWLVSGTSITSVEALLALAAENASVFNV